MLRIVVVGLLLTVLSGCVSQPGPATAPATVTEVVTYSAPPEACTSAAPSNHAPIVPLFRDPEALMRQVAQAYGDRPAVLEPQRSAFGGWTQNLTTETGRIMVVLDEGTVVRALWYFRDDGTPRDGSATLSQVLGAVVPGLGAFAVDPLGDTSLRAHQDLAGLEFQAATLYQWQDPAAHEQLYLPTLRDIHLARLAVTHAQAVVEAERAAACRLASDGRAELVPAAWTNDEPKIVEGLGDTVAYRIGLQTASVSCGEAAFASSWVMVWVDAETGKALKVDYQPPRC